MNPTDNHSETPASPMTATPSAVADVQQFIKSMKDKNPQEVLGIGTATGLVTALVQSTIGTLALFALFTVGPYVWSKTFPAAPKESVAKTPPKVEPTQPGKTPPATNAATVAVPSTEKNPPVSKEVLEKIGVTDTKTAPSKVNPLDKSTDDLLKDLDKK